MDSMSKRDRKRQQINVRVAKHESSFVNERDQYYRSSVHEIQSVLVNLHRGNHEKLMMLRDNLEIERDYELTRLRLWEEYQVKQVEQEYLQDLVRAKENKERMIKLIKEKLYDKLQLQVKQLKEDKLLLNLVNANSWNSNDPTKAALNAAAMNLNEKRSLRKREISSRFTTGEADDLSDGGIGNGSATGTSGANISNGYISALKRRRHYATRYSSNDEMSSGINSSVTNNHSTRMSGISSGNDSNLSDKDYDELNSLIMHNEDGGASLMFSSENKSSGKPNTRGSHRQFVGVQGLKPEELQDDLDLLKSAITKK
jgi:hypothetical protein